MSVFENFIPSKFNSLSIEEKKDAIIDLAYYLFNSLKLEPIPILFDKKSKKDGSILSGKFFHERPSIFINEIFLNSSNLSNLFQNQIKDIPSYIPYHIIHTVAHECYHYYQFHLVKQLVAGAVPEDKRVIAHLYFICLFSNLFSNYNDNFGLSEPSKLSDKELYLFTPTEIEANSFAYDINTIFNKLINDSSYEQYDKMRFDEKCNLLDYNISRGGHLTEQTILYNLRIALDFLNYKNKTSGLKTNYLGIDIEELQRSVKEAMIPFVKAENNQLKLFNKIFKK